jgi:hypothetical protein
MPVWLKDILFLTTKELIHYIAFEKLLKENLPIGKVFFYDNRGCY